ncbi:hypothetical protein [Roseovarius ramblicola]|uniref:Tat pathway signal sequence domain protein n=1 Tax=Roseovarius ramblicola TaxID=2022336 RepID=A0ABV5I326_9RHOB
MTSENFTRRAFITTAAGGAAALISGCGMTAPVSRARGGPVNIGFGLWTGVPGVTFGDRVDNVEGIRRISGPRTWTHPVTGRPMTVYVRTKQEDAGPKIGYYTLRADGSALSRVYDSRPDRSDRFFLDDALMPQGIWQGGVTKTYSMTAYAEGKATKYNVSIRVTKPSFSYKGRAGSMEYIWSQTTMGGREVRKLRYTYSPGIGFVDIDNLM